MTNRQILRIAMEQSAIDSGCRPEDFAAGGVRIVDACAHPRARRYLKLPFLCVSTSSGSGVVASVSPPYRALAEEYLARFDAVHCFETPNLHWLMQRLALLGANVCFMAEYFLPDAACRPPRTCPFEMRLLAPADFAGLYLPQWSNALCAERAALDMLAVGAYDGGQLIGLAGASADCDAMWQIGVDVLPQYRRKGLAEAITSRLSAETAALGKVPFYCAAWSNIPSVRNALACGFYPSWVQLTAVPME